MNISVFFLWSGKQYLTRNSKTLKCILNIEHNLAFSKSSSRWSTARVVQIDVLARNDNAFLRLRFFWCFAQHEFSFAQEGASYAFSSAAAGPRVSLLVFLSPLLGTCVMFCSGTISTRDDAMSARSLTSYGMVEVVSDSWLWKSATTMAQRSETGSLMENYCNLILSYCQALCDRTYPVAEPFYSRMVP